MTKIFVSRHDGAIDWAREEGFIGPDTRIVSDFDAETVVPGVVVVGTLPTQIAARICALGGRYQHLSLDLRPDLRGQELSAAQMRTCGARLEEFFIQRSTVRRGGADDTLHVCIASDQTLQNLIPALTPDIKATQVLILASDRMLASAKRLRHGLQAAGLADHRISVHTGLPDADFGEIVRFGNALCAELNAVVPTPRIILNATGGTKLMHSGLMQAFRICAEIIYCDTEHDRVDFLHPPGSNALKLPVNLVKREVYIAVKGFRVRPETPDHAGIAARGDVTRHLAEAAPQLDRLIGLMNRAADCHERGQTSQALIDLPQRAFEREVAGLLVEHKLLQSVGANMLRITDDTAAAYLKGGWLEEWCAIIAKSLEQGEQGQRLHPNRWGINLRIDPYDDTPIPGRNQFSLNELDAVVIHRNKLLLIECKSGVQISERGKSQDILNKIEALGKHVGGPFDSKWLLTARRIEKNAQAAQRAALYGIKIIHPEQLIDLEQLIRAWMTG